MNLLDIFQLEEVDKAQADIKKIKIIKHPTVDVDLEVVAEADFKKINLRYNATTVTSMDISVTSADQHTKWMKETM